MPMSKEKLEILRAITNMIPSIPDEQFDMHRFWTERKCGTVGCVIGHAIMRGLCPGLQLTDRFGSIDLLPIDEEGRDGFRALKVYFEDPSVADLFDPGSYHYLQEAEDPDDEPEVLVNSESKEEVSKLFQSELVRLEAEQANNNK